MAKGLALSDNLITAQVMKSLGDDGPDLVGQFAERVGIQKNRIPRVPSICLGTIELSPFEMASAYSAFVNKGLWVEPSFITRIEDKDGNVLEEFRNFKNNTYETSFELYYKQMDNQIEYKDGYTPNTLEDTENSFVFGKGWSYGTELFINKIKGRLTGWVGYSLSWTWRKFPDLNNGEKYPAKYDRRNDLSIVALYELNKKWKISASFVYGTGNATSLPERFYLIQNVLTQEYSKINQYRLPAYHRLDISAILTPKKNANRKWKTEWVFSLYNAYSRKNPYFIYFDQTGSASQGSLQIQAKQVSIFPIIPAVTWNFKF
jgi:hypothetical protein